MKTTNKFRSVTSSAFILLLPLLFLSGCAESSRDTVNHDTVGKSDDKIKIVAAENFYAEAAEAVGKDHVDVTPIMSNANAEPHDFEPTTETAKLVSQAEIVIYNGLGFDNWMDQLLQSSADHSKTIIQVGTDIAGKKEGDNEHVWYIPQVMPQLATVIADKLSELDPGNAEDYHRHASDYIASLAPLQELIDKLKQREPVTVGVSEPVFNYMLDALNFRANNDNFPLAIEKGIDPAPADFAHMQDDLKNKKVKFLVQNLQAESPTVAHLVQMAQEHDVPILKVTETIPEGKNYSTWMSEQLKQIERIMDTHQ